MGVKARTAWLRLYRATVFAGVILMVHRGAPPADPGAAIGVSVEALREYFPSAVGVGERLEAHGGHFVLDANRNRLGFVVATSPDSDHLVGYSGPNNVLVAFGGDGKVLGFSIISSGDTAEHVADVEADRRFMATFDGMRWEEVQAMRRVDGVSGATLTSLAVAEGIIRRLQGSAPSLRFPEPLQLADARRIFPAADEIDAAGTVSDAVGQRLGRLLRTSPHGDNLVGYAGPSDLLVGVAGEGDTIVGIAIRDSYDTEKYVGYVADEAGFMEMFNGKTLAEMAAFDLQANEVEGVSGATMTSLAVVEALVALARAEGEPEIPTPAAWADWTSYEFGSRGVGTVLVVAFGLLLAFTGLRGVRWLRVAFQLVLIGYLGLVNGDLLSQAVLSGWAEHGLAWRFAPGMLLLVAAALLVPLFAGKQVYCHQLCPHGAAQQLLKNVLPTQWRIGVPRRLAAGLRSLPYLLLLWVVVVSVLQLGFKDHLASIEPFHAYLFRTAGWATIAIALGGLCASLFIPMAYCRYGCPTGAMLNFLWAGGRADKFSRRDGLALACLLLAVALRLATN